MDMVTITEARKQTGLTIKQIRDRIANGEITATRDSKGGKRATWLIDPATLPERVHPQDNSKAASRLELKNKLTTMQIKKIEQHLKSGQAKIITDHKSECEAQAIESITHFIGIIKRKLKLTSTQQTIWNKEIDKFTASYGI